MKKFFFLILLVLCVQFSFAQIYDREFKPFRIDFTSGYGIPKGSGSSGGLLFAAEPRYAFTGDALDFGLRLEAVMLKPSVTINGAPDPGATDSLQSEANVSALITCDYYFNNNMIRPFMGAGAGIYSLAQEIGKSEGALLPDYAFYQRFGAILRGGIEWSHVRAAIEYNFVSNPNQTLTGYFGIKVGVFLGGGRFELISGNNSPY